MIEREIGHEAPCKLTGGTELRLDHDCAETVTSAHNMSSSIRDNTERHRFELDADGHVAFSNYKRANGVLTILHTEVPQALEGRGIGSALIRGVLDIARSQGLKVVTVCPFAKAYVEHHPEYADLVA